MKIKPNVPSKLSNITEPNYADEVMITFVEIEELMRECGKAAMTMYRPEMTLTLISIT